MPPTERLPRLKRRKKMKLCAYEGCHLTQGFIPRKRKQRYCSRRCALLDAWSKGSGRKDGIRKFYISREELQWRMDILGQDPQTIAHIFRKSPKTVYARAKEFGIIPENIRKQYRSIRIPKDRVCFLLKVSPDQGADMEMIVKQILHEQRLDLKTGLEIFEPLMLAVSPVAN